MNVFKENIGGSLPLHYYNHLNEHMKRDEHHEGGGAAFYNQDVTNPNSANRTCAWPVVVRSDMVQSDQRIMATFRLILIRSLVAPGMWWPEKSLDLIWILR